jgi:hypothetical protein
MWRPRGREPGEVVTLLHNPNQIAMFDAADAVLAADITTGGGNNSSRWAYTILSMFAGRGGGKTEGGGFHVSRRTLNQVKAKNARTPLTWVTAPTYDDLHDFTMPAFFKYMPEQAIVDESAAHRTIYLKNGHVVSFRSLEDPDEGRGPTLDNFWIDETRKVVRKAWLNALPAIRRTRGQNINTTSPNGFDWCYNSLWLPAQTGVPGMWAVRFKTIDNPTIDRALIEADRAIMDPKFFAQEYEAEFVTFSGAVYDIEKAILRSDEEIREKTGLTEWPNISSEREIAVGMDPGTDHPFAQVIAVKAPKGWVFFGESLLRNKPLSENVRAFQRLLAYNAAHPFEPNTVAIDRSAKMVQLDLWDVHRIMTSPAQNAVTGDLGGIRRVKSWLEADQLWFIESLVPRTIEQMRGYQWADPSASGENRREAVKKIEDDLCDALRYLLMSVSAPNLSSVVVGGRSTRDLTTIAPEHRWIYERLKITEGRPEGSGIIGWDEFFERDVIAEMYDPNSSGIIGASSLESGIAGYPGYEHGRFDSFFS